MFELCLWPCHFAFLVSNLMLKVKEVNLELVVYRVIVVKDFLLEHPKKKLLRVGGWGGGGNYDDGLKLGADGWGGRGGGRKLLLLLLLSLSFSLLKKSSFARSLLNLAHNSKSLTSGAFLNSLLRSFLFTNVNFAYEGASHGVLCIEMLYVLNNSSIKFWFLIIFFNI